jgi:hypothetical protein
MSNTLHNIKILADLGIIRSFRQHNNLFDFTILAHEIFPNRLPKHVMNYNGYYKIHPAVPDRESDLLYRLTEFFRLSPYPCHALRLIGDSHAPVASTTVETSI